jgi:hypothetical protein
MRSELKQYQPDNKDKKQFQTGTQGFKQKKRTVKHPYLMEGFVFDSERKQ